MEVAVKKKINCVDLLTPSLDIVLNCTSINASTKEERVRFKHSCLRHILGRHLSAHFHAVLTRS